MKISIIVPAFNEQRLLPDSLGSIKHAMQEFIARGWEAELIVCDNNSTDQTAEVARKAGAQVVFEPINQIGRARNRGATAASGDWLLFIDADSFPTRQLFAEVAERIACGNFLAGGSTVRFERYYRFGSLIVGLWNWFSCRLRWVAGSFIFCESAAFKKVGGFSNELFASEELDLSRRLKRLARETGKAIVILNANPLLTSARKLHLYTMREHLLFLAKTVLAGGKTLNSREACHTWYDGRR